MNPSTDVPSQRYKQELNDVIMFATKTNQERIEICKIRAEIFGLKTENTDLKSQLKSMKESLDGKTFMTSQNQEKLQKEQKSHAETEQLKNELKSLKDSFEGLKNIVLSQNQDQPKNEQETESNKELKNSVTSQNQDQLKNEQETDSNNENAKEIKLEKVEDHVEELLKLNQILKDLKKDNSKLAKEIERKDSVIENLKEELLKLSKENADLKYGK